MLIELTELLLCPAGHRETYCVLAAEKTLERRVVRGTVGCPLCHNEYRIADGVVEFGPDPLLGPGSRADDLTLEEMPEAEVVHTLLGLDTPGGYVALVGSVGRIAVQLASSMSGVHFVAINPPPDVSDCDALSILRASASIPIRASTLRGVVVGGEYARNPWLHEARRVVQNGLHLVVASGNVEIPGVETMTAGSGLWVGRRIG